MSDDPTTPLPAAPPSQPESNPTSDAEASPESSTASPVVDLAEKRTRRSRPRKVVVSVLAASLVVGVTSYAVVASRGSAQRLASVTPITNAPSYGGPSAGQGNASPPAPPSWGEGQPGVLPRQGTLSDSTDTTAATEAQQVGVVDIYTVLSGGSQAAGTGMVLTSDGEILTNNHVIEGSTQIEVVVVATGTTYDASVVGTDAGDDIAVLQLADASGLDPVTTDTSTAVAVGDQVTGVGNAGGDGGDPSAAAGTVVALDQDITVQRDSGSGREHLTGLIEVDADIISGDSGGPLYDADTEVVGIDTAASSGRVNVRGYAIPIGTALEIVDDIEAGREVDGIQLGYPGYLGVALADDPAGTTPGVPVAGVQAGSAAAQAGIGAGDTVTSVDGTPVQSAKQLARLVSAHQPGDSVQVSWTDSAGTTHTTTVTLGQGPAV